MSLTNAILITNVILIEILLHNIVFSLTSSHKKMDVIEGKHCNVVFHWSLRQGLTFN